MTERKVMLRNGTQERVQLVGIIEFQVDTLLRTDPTAVLELVEKARDPDYKPSDPSVAVLTRRNILDEDGKLHGSVSNIIQSMAVGEGMDMQFVSPVASDLKNVLTAKSGHTAPKP